MSRTGNGFAFGRMLVDEAIVTAMNHVGDQYHPFAVSSTDGSVALAGTIRLQISLPMKPPTTVASTTVLVDRSVNPCPSRKRARNAAPPARSAPMISPLL